MLEVAPSRCSGRVTACWLALSLAAGPAALSHDDADARIRALDRRIAEEPPNASLFLDRGELHRIEGDHGAALADYARARALDPGLVVVDLCVGRAHLESDRPAEAVEVLTRYLANRPGDARALALRGTGRAALGDHLLAAEDLSYAIALHGDRDPSLGLYLARARALREAGGVHLAEALTGLDEGLERLGRPVTLELMALDLERTMGRFESALARLDRLVAGARRPEPWLVRRGEVLEQAGRREEARQAYEAARVALEVLPAPVRRRGGAVGLAVRVDAALRRLSDGG